MSVKENGLLLIGGEGPTIQYIERVLDSVRYIIAANSGFDLACRLNLEPDLLVGDLDSIAKSKRFKSLSPEKLKKFPEDKDETDLEIGLNMFKEMGFKRVILMGGGGGRLDHLLGIICLFERDYYPYAWFTAREHIQVINSEMEFENWKGQTVSFFPLGDEAGDMHSEGLKWSLDGLCWKRGEAGISNIITADQGRVCVGHGKILMIRTLPELQDA